MRTQQYRLDAGGGQGKKAVTGGRLYDMVADPGQERTLRRSSRKSPRGLRDEAASWRAELSPKRGPATTGRSRSAIPPSTPLPARDGVPHGSVQRSDTAPNCSFFTNWTSPDDRITWDVEVGKPGRYEAVVYYTCAAGDVGSTVELSLATPSLQTQGDRSPRSAALWQGARPRRCARRVVHEGFQADEARDVRSESRAEAS